AARTQRELVDPVAGEAGVGVAVDEARDRAQSATVELHRRVLDAPEVAHASGADDHAFLAEEVRVLDHVDAPEVCATQRGALAGRADGLSWAAGGRAGGAGGVPHSSGASRRIGSWRSCAAAAASASS